MGKAYREIRMGSAGSEPTTFGAKVKYFTSAA
jgi:hypothetical protein